MLHFSPVFPNPSPLSLLLPFASYHWHPLRRHRSDRTVPLLTALPAPHTPGRQPFSSRSSLRRPHHLPCRPCTLAPVQNTGALSQILKYPFKHQRKSTLWPVLEASSKATPSRHLVGLPGNGLCCSLWAQSTSGSDPMDKPMVIPLHTQAHYPLLKSLSV